MALPTRSRQNQVEFFKCDLLSLHIFIALVELFSEHCNKLFFG